MRYALLIGAVLGAVAVLLGAFAAHGLKARLSPESLVEYLAVLQTAVLYQFIHALALLLVVVLAQQRAARALVVAAGCFILGVLLFSGSLYVLVLTPFKPGLITPIGGVFLVIGWCAVAYSALRKV